MLYCAGTTKVGEGRQWTCTVRPGESGLIERKESGILACRNNATTVRACVPTWQAQEGHCDEGKTIRLLISCTRKINKKR